MDDIYNDAMADTICIFIINIDTLDKYGWDDIRDTYRILQRYDVSLHEMKKLDANLTFPPDERMKDIKMYPPFYNK